ncbi:MAG TPA: M14 family zinc carboxypeptidase [Thermoanaerobaculia bacterium]|nr:M14 family zinc carboxypeptidase [Thermoanaerobaculia bacterium]
MDRLPKTVLFLLAVAAQPLHSESGAPIATAASAFSRHHEVVEHFQALDAASPRLTLHQYGTTWEGRPLIYAAITSEENLGTIEPVRRRIMAVSQPDRTSRAEASRIAQDTPVVVWLAFGIHGSESSSTEAAMQLASRLVSDEPGMAEIRRQCIVIIDPLQNPDGRERYVQWYGQARGIQPNALPEAIEHFEPWPGGRYNHYLIDLNRDWAWATQRETAARIAAYREWNPQVFVDFHEMAPRQSYFFPPSAQPLNTNISTDVPGWLDVFGKANAEAFAERGWSFFVGETFDLFYPGYGDSWPSLRGAIGMTYEVAGGSRAGEVVRREDGTILTLSDRIERHLAAAMTTLVTSSRHRRALLLRTWDALAANLQASAPTYLISSESPGAVHLVRALSLHGIEVRTLTAATRLRARSLAADREELGDFPVGTFVVSTRQPLGGLANALLEKSPSIPETFVTEQRRRVDADEEEDFYDVTTWSLPIAMNVDAWVVPSSQRLDTVSWSAAPRSGELPQGRFAYLIDGLDSHIHRAAGLLLARGVRFSVSETSILARGRQLARGSIVILRSNNPVSLHQIITEVLEESDARVIGVDAAWEGGTALGSPRIRYVRDPRIALIAGPGIHQGSLGSLWHALDVEYSIPHTVIPLERFASVDLSQFRVIVLPDGDGYASRLGAAGIERLEGWINAGGVAIAIKRGAAFLREKDVAISKVRVWPGLEDDEEPPPPDRHRDFRIPGAAFRTTMVSSSYLTFGLATPPAVFLEGSTALLPVSYRADNVVRIAESSPLASGFAWPESIERIAGAAWLVTESLGKGRVITFADHPYFRLFWRGTLPPFLNAVLYSPTFAAEE